LRAWSGHARSVGCLRAHERLLNPENVYDRCLGARIESGDEIGTRDELVLAEIITSDVSLLVTFNQVIDGVSKNAGVPGKIPHDFRRTAVRNLERAGVARSAAMKIVGHKTKPIYRRYAIAEEKTLIEGADELEQFHAFDQQDAKPSK
jgi:hypothetical protein